MKGRIIRGDYAAPMIRILYEHLDPKFNAEDDFPKVLRELREQWPTAVPGSVKTFSLEPEVQVQLVDALSTLLEKTGDETDWVTRKEIYHRIYSYDSGLWSKMEHIEFQDSTDFKKVRAPSCLLLHPHTTNPNPPHSIPLFRHMLRLKARSWRWIWPSSTTGGKDSRARDLMILL